MKNIIIFGVPRSGKTTFARMILKEFPEYNIIEEDIVFTAYEAAATELADLRCPKSDRLEVTLDVGLSNRIAEHLFTKNVLYEPKLNFILETSNLKFEKLKDYSKDNIVLVFGYPQLTVEECINNANTYDTKEDWSYITSIWTLKHGFEVFLKESKQYQEDCKKLNLKFVDTSYSRKEVLNDALKWLKENINNQQKISKLTC